MAKIKLTRSQFYNYQKDTLRKYSKRSTNYKIKTITNILLNIVILSVFIYLNQLLIIPLYIYFIINIYFDKKYNDYFLNEILVNINADYLKLNILDDEFILNNNDTKFIRALDQAYLYSHKSYISIFIPYDSLDKLEQIIMENLHTKYDDGYRHT